jgi:protein subunit release factor B
MNAEKAFVSFASSAVAHRLVRISRPEKRHSRHGEAGASQRLGALTDSLNYRLSQLTILGPVAAVVGIGLA